jgi:hypothetical protein
VPAILGRPSMQHDDPQFRKEAKQSPQRLGTGERLPLTGRLMRRQEERMARPGLADRDDLLRWAATVPARAEFPRLIRRLVLETAPEAVQLGFPAGTGVSAGGWDGSVRTITGNAFVPVGLSVWELSVNEGVTGKADEDYGKRTGTPDGSPASDAVYVEAILRPWTARDTWAAGKRGDQRWKDVRAYGVDDVEEWLESAPVTHAWISELLGSGPYGYRAAESWWRDWATATAPELPACVVLAGRDQAVTTLKNRLDGAPTVTTVKGGSTEEVLAFIAAVLDRQAAGGDARWRSRAAFVDQVTSWRALAERASPLILVPGTPDVAREAARGISHHILVPVIGAASADVELIPIDASAAAAALHEAGLDEARTEAAGRLARRSLLGLRRDLAIKPELHTPGWAESPSRVLRGLLLGGRWNEDSTADKTAVTELTGGDYDTLRETLARLAREKDPFIAQIGSAWMLVSPQDAWIQLRAAIRRDDLDRLEPVLRRVLLELDPALELSPENRLYAAVVGKSPEHSAELRGGLAVTLALLGINGDVVDAGHGSDGIQWTARIVAGLLQAANDDKTGAVWNSQAHALPRLAEAAPAAFLNGLRDAATGADPVIAALFTDGHGAGVSAEFSGHHYLLWALEALAWSPEDFGQVIDLLARLTEIDPGGRMRNRPLNSLTTIFCLRHPGTLLSVQRRMAVLDRMRQRHPDVAWQLMMALLPAPMALYDRLRDPEFRDWKQQEPAEASPAEWLASVGELVTWLVQDAGDDARRWQQLLDRLPMLPPADRERIRAELAARAVGSTLGDDGRTDLWETLRELIARHRSHAGMQWALPAGELDALQDVEQALAPAADPAQLYAWLFARQMPDLGDGTRRNDFGVYDTALRERRTAAVTAVEEHGLDAVRGLAANAVDARIIGACLADAVADKYCDQLVGMIPADTVADEGLAQGWLSRRFEQAGRLWLDGILAGDLTADQQALTLLASRDYPKAWEVADTRGVPVADAFWRRFSIVGLGHGFAHVTEAARRLAQAGRVSAALKLTTVYLDLTADGHADFLIWLLREFVGKYQADPELRLLGLSEYDFQSVFQYLNQHAGPEHRAEIGQLEWAFLAVLGFEPLVGPLYEALAADPGFFVQVMQVTWTPPGDQSDHDDDTVPDPEVPTTAARAQQAENGRRLLTSFDRLPGTDAQGTLDAGALRDWTAQVLQLAGEAGLGDAAEMLVGQILANAPTDADGAWPCQPVRDLLEDLQNGRVERSLTEALYNRRGLTARSPEDGGQQERALAQTYRAQADTLADRWPRIAAVLRDLASMYDTDARQEESKAERFRQGQHR